MSSIPDALPAARSPLRWLADALSAANLVCGGIGIACALVGRFEGTLFFLLLGAVCDGLDGLAARRFGGTRFGVLADDLADGVNFGLAPGVALAVGLGGRQGVIVGGCFALFTIGRLIYFTLQQDQSDPRFFPGVPSTVGGLVALCSLLVFPQQPALVGLGVGVACSQMVAFRTHYRHLGRALASRELPRRAAAAGFAWLLLGTAAWGIQGSVALILAACLAYGFLPSALAFASALGSGKAHEGVVCAQDEEASEPHGDG
jgi:CDP-diacylglycerol--serine O-phosphatidyltransferase